MHSIDILDEVMRSAEDRRTRERLGHTLLPLITDYAAALSTVQTLQRQHDEARGRELPRDFGHTLADARGRVTRAERAILSTALAMVGRDG